MALNWERLPKDGEDLKESVTETQAQIPIGIIEYLQPDIPVFSTMQANMFLFSLSYCELRGLSLRMKSSLFNKRK